MGTYYQQVALANANNDKGPGAAGYPPEAFHYLQAQVGPVGPRGPPGISKFILNQVIPASFFFFFLLRSFVPDKNFLLYFIRII